MYPGHCKLAIVFKNTRYVTYEVTGNYKGDKKDIIAHYTGKAISSRSSGSDKKDEEV